MSSFEQFLSLNQQVDRQIEDVTVTIKTKYQIIIKYSKRAGETDLLVFWMMKSTMYSDDPSSCRIARCNAVSSLLCHTTHSLTKYTVIHTRLGVNNLLFLLLLVLLLNYSLYSCNTNLLFKVTSNCVVYKKIHKITDWKLFPLPNQWCQSVVY